jgi:hypothetical protein
MTWIGTGITVAGTLYGAASANSSAKAGAAQSRVSGFAAQKESALNDATAQQEALDIKQAARDQADQIKRSAMQRRGQILVAQSASGTVIGEGSAQAAMDQLETLSSADALVALYSGVNAAASRRHQGRLGLQAGSEKATAFGMEAASQEAAGQRALVGGLLTAGAQVAGGYAKSKK